MPGSVYTKRPTRQARVRLLAVATVATVVSGVLVAGCGGSSPRLTPAAVGGARTPGSTAGSRPSAGRSGSTASGAGGPALEFARCMRANGVPDFPDPNPGGGARFAIPVGTSPAAPAFKAAQAKCQRFMPLPPGPGSDTHAAARTMARLVKIARCMREHGVSGFPDPRTSVPSNPAGIQVITDYDGAILLFPSTINMQAPAYKQALTACGAPPLGLPH